MIHVAAIEEPPHFHQQVREPGLKWLDDRLLPWALAGCHAPQPRFPGHWTRVTEELRAAFGQRCSYSAMFITDGQVEHHRCRAHYPDLAYEWGNLRYAAARLNARKNTLEVLDPYEVEEGWFEVLLPSLELVMTDRIPRSRQGVAEQTLKRLLRHRQVRQQREAWYEEFWTGELNLPNLGKKDPLCARAVHSRLREVMQRHASTHQSEVSAPTTFREIRRSHRESEGCRICKGLTRFRHGHWTLATMRIELPQLAELIEDAVQAQPQ